MGTAILTLSLAYALPLALAALALTKAGLRSRTAAVVLSLLPVFYLLHYQGLKQLAGWPATTSPPERFNLIAEQVREPNQQTGQPGAVYVWLNTPDAPLPRAFELPYSLPLHQELAEASQRRSAGKPQVGSRREPAGAASSGNSGENHPDYEFFDRPLRRLPPKGDSATAG